jgi:hypothetical protein
MPPDRRDEGVETADGVWRETKALLAGVKTVPLRHNSCVKDRE